METKTAGRPSVAAERRTQIIDAALRVFAAHSITGVTLERIAEEAGMARGHVRHFAGNRDAIMAAAARRFYFDGTDGESFFPTDVTDLDTAFDYLFGSEFASPGGDNDVAKGFLVAARTNPEIAVVTNDAYRGTQRALGAFIAAAIPDASTREVHRTAYGLLTIALGNVFMEELTPAAELTATAQEAAHQLLSALRT